METHSTQKGFGADIGKQEIYQNRKKQSQWKIERVIECANDRVPGQHNIHADTLCRARFVIWLFYVINFP